MPRTVFIGGDSFETLRERNYFYVDKTDFIRQWWDQGGLVTAIMRPRRFGKTLTLNMVQCFFSEKYAGRGDLFEGLSIWEEERYRNLQGTYPVLFLSFAEVKKPSFEDARDRICFFIKNLYAQHRFLLEGDTLCKEEKEEFQSHCAQVPHERADVALWNLMSYLSRHHGKKVIVLLDEYDTPLQEAYVHGYWQELVEFLRPLFGTTFKGNPYLERGLMTGITRIAKESIFSDMNNLDMVTVTSGKYGDCFGFTQQEVDAALEEYGYIRKRAQVKKMYDGFTFGKNKDIYNPWSVTKFLNVGEVETFWANTSGNALAGDLVRQGSLEMKDDFVLLLERKTIERVVDEKIAFGQLDQSDAAAWGLLLSAGYLKATRVRVDKETWEMHCRLSLTNGEVRATFHKLIRGWFTNYDLPGERFVQALLRDDLDIMNSAMRALTENTVSTFDVPGKSGDAARQPEMFYHAFVLGLVSFLHGRYVIESNRESGDGRYDLQMTPKKPKVDPAILIEFKVRDRKVEKDLAQTVQRALQQIEEKNYAQNLIAHGFEERQIRKYGFAFDGKKVLIGR